MKKRGHLVMPAHHTLHLGLTKSQMEWIEKTSQDSKRSKSKLIQDLITAHQKTESLEEKLSVVIQKNTQLETHLHALGEQVQTQLEILLTYVKEIFRESAANLYRLNAVIDEFAEPEKVRFEVNEFVRQQESILRAKALNLQEAKALNLQDAKAHPLPGSRP